MDAAGVRPPLYDTPNAAGPAGSVAAVPDWLTGKPLVIVVSVLFGIVFLRAQLTYWVARGLAEGARRTRWSDKMSGPRVTRAVDTINRWGAPVVTLSFLTIGFQTAANAAAGLTRMPFLRYLIAMIPGCLAWAFIYATVGLAAVGAAVVLAAKSPWVLVVLGLLVVAGIATLIVRRGRRRVEPTGTGEEAEV